MNKIMQIQTDNSVSGTILTIFFSLISIQDIDMSIKIVATLASAVAGFSTAYINYKKYKSKQNEKNTD